MSLANVEERVFSGQFNSARRSAQLTSYSSRPEYAIRESSRLVINSFRLKSCTGFWRNPDFGWAVNSVHCPNADGRKTVFAA